MSSLLWSKQRFGCIDHNRIMLKLEALGIRGTAFHGINLVLFNGIQYASIKQTKLRYHD